ncbi:hypothetical protein MUN81_21525 [Hymenobacter sp. 5317J-9]|uniref:hypothetical protein n=1 Tax=Hymenobacter sp. 5317J-9 TaxID=2932250 RepID=UPI001FD6843A|nr:hypothetical protein [Hymenobacter sp. 5317J-9]UOQ97794.1 hypothetical protein MUN81_21525 [Hymenobacter sp. 5317J-9]
MRNPLLFVLALALTGPAAFSQTIPPPASAARAPQYEHCILVLEDAYHAGNSLHLEYGQDVRKAAPKPELLQANATVRRLNSVVAALDYMSSQGWECINVNSLPGATAETGYLLRRAK